MVCAIPPAVPALFIVSARVRCKQHAPGFERRMQFVQHARQFPSRHVEQRSIGKDAVEIAGLFLSDIVPGSEDVQACLAKFRKLQNGVQSVHALTGNEEESDTVYEIVSTSKAGNKKVKLSITSGEGSLACKVE